jgi:hypothetical protein
MFGVNQIYSNIFNDETDELALNFLAPNNVNLLSDVMYEVYIQHMGKTTRKYFVPKIVNLMEKWIQTIPRNHIYFNTKINNLNEQFIKENYEVILGDITRHTTEKYDPQKTLNYQQIISWGHDDMTYVRNNDLEVYGEQLQPRHVSQKMLTKRNYLWKREEPITNASYNSRGCHLRSMDMFPSGYDNRKYKNLSKNFCI